MGTEFVVDWTPIGPVMPGQTVEITEQDLEDESAIIERLISLDGKGWTELP